MVALLQTDWSQFAFLVFTTNERFLYMLGLSISSLSLMHGTLGSVNATTFYFGDFPLSFHCPRKYCKPCVIHHHFFACPLLPLGFSARHTRLITDSGTFLVTDNRVIKGPLGRSLCLLAPLTCSAALRSLHSQAHSLTHFAHSLVGS